jgi:uncharacterized Fe-S radical SAM superfamily protein PflX
VSDLGSLSVWQDSAIRGALSWYLAVAENEHPAKFRIAATLATDIDPATSSEEALWAELDRLTPRPRTGGSELSAVPMSRTSSSDKIDDRTLIRATPLLIN